MKSKEKIIFSVFAGLGLLLLPLGVGLGWKSYNFAQTAQRTDGTVSRLIQSYDRTKNTPNYTYAPEVSYRTKSGEEKLFISSMYSNPSAYAVGEKLTILYNNDRVEVDSLWGLYGGSIVCLIVGLVMALVGMGGWAWLVRRQKIISRLKTSGQKISAKVKEIIVNKNYAVNGRHPWKIVAEGQGLDGQVGVYTSDNIWVDPSAQMPIGKDIAVYVNPAKPKEYFVEV